jgi:hypothetical protein
MKGLPVIVALAVFPSTLCAGDCRSLPFGSERDACVSRQSSAMFQAKRPRCKGLSLERAVAQPTGKGSKPFMEACLRGTLN